VKSVDFPEISCKDFLKNFCTYTGKTDIV